jgi:hypothetical protein
MSAAVKSIHQIPRAVIRYREPRALLDEFDDGNGGAERMATITSEHYAELEALIARGALR